MAQAKLAILVVLAHCVDKALLRDEEAEVVAARHSFNLDLVTEGHLNWVADLLSLHGERPGESVATFTG